MPVSVKYGLSRRRPLRDCFHLRSIRIQVEGKRCLADQFLSSVTKTVTGGPIQINDGSMLEVQNEEGVACVVHKRAKARLALAQSVLGLFACRPGTQGDDAERHVGSQFLKKPNLFRRKSVGLRGMNGKTAEGSGLVVLERQGDAGTKTALQKALPPGGESRIGCEILYAAALPAPDGRSGEAAPTLRVGPGYAGGCEISLLGPGPRDRAHAFGLVVFGIGHKRHAVARLLADDPADYLQQALLIGGVQQDLVAVADRSQFAIQTTQRLLGTLAL